MGTGIGRMFCKDFQALLGGIGVDGAPELTQMVVDGQRALAARLVFDDAGEVALGITQFDGRQMRNPR